MQGWNPDGSGQPMNELNNSSNPKEEESGVGLL